MVIYASAWIAVMVGMCGWICCRPDSFTFMQRGYMAFLLTPWKLTTFLIAAGAFIAVAPLTGDPTWDPIDACLMSLCTYLSAPWVIGILFRWPTSGWSQCIVAVLLWMFSASWSYDGYLWIRDHRYPDTWAVNIPASSVLYVAAGLFWNLDWVDGLGVDFAFRRPDWPHGTSGSQFRRIAPLALPFIVLIGSILAYSVFS